MKTTPVWIASGLGMLLWLAGCSNDEPAMSGAEDSAASTEDSAASIEDSATSIEGAANTQADSPDAAPQYEVDPSWPRQLPNRWSLGQVSGIATDSQDNIWIIQRPRTLNEHEMGAAQNPPMHDCCMPAPSVIAFNQAGEVIRAWGGPTWDQEQGEWVEPADGWPAGEHGIFVDYQDNVWIGGNGMSDHVVLKFTPEGERLLRIGEWQTNMGSNDTRHLGRPADITVDPETHEVYIADGYLNRRVIVFDADTGEYKRHWGAFGNVPDDSIDNTVYLPDADPVQVWHNPVHAVRIANDGLVYVADRQGNRIHVFNKDGSFVKEGRFATWTIGGQGAAWDIEFSRDPQRWLFAADGANKKVWIMERDTLEVVSSFGHGGRQAGQFGRIHVFNKDGSFVKEGRFATWTIGGQGAAWDIEFSRDPEQRWLFAADGANKKVWIMERDTLEVVSSFGHGGRQAGQFEWVHNITADSFANLYTSEVNTGKRVQKWVPVGSD